MLTHAYPLTREHFSLANLQVGEYLYLITYSNFFTVSRTLGDHWVVVKDDLRETREFDEWWKILGYIPDSARIE